MNFHTSALRLLLPMCSIAAFAQAPAPSITLGTHILTLGMPESTVLEQLGTDLIVRRLPSGAGPISSAKPPESAWVVQRKTESGFVNVGSLSFDNQKLSSAVRNSDIEESSGKSLFYAINEAIARLERDGLRTCQISTYGKNQMVDAPSGNGSGSLNMSEVLIDCGTKKVKITLYLSDVSGMTPTQIDVSEWLQRK